MGVSARDMLNAIAEGEEDPEKLANFARRTMKKKKDELMLALKGYINSHQRLLLKTILKHVNFLTEQSRCLNKRSPKELASIKKTLTV